VRNQSATVHLILVIGKVAPGCCCVKLGNMVARDMATMERFNPSALDSSTLEVRAATSLFVSGSSTDIIQSRSGGIDSGTSVTRPAGSMRSTTLKRICSTCIGTVIGMLSCNYSQWPIVHDT
jgi:hypothetical protein